MTQTNGVGDQFRGDIHRGTEAHTPDSAGDHLGADTQRRSEASAINVTGTRETLDTHGRAEAGATNDVGGDQTVTGTQTAGEPADTFVYFGLLARQAAASEQVSRAYQQQRKSLLKYYHDTPLVVESLWHLSAEQDEAAATAPRLKRQLHRDMPDPVVREFVDDTLGLGVACAFFMGLLPKWIAEFETVSKLWAYCGLHVVDGAAPKRAKGQRANWSARLKSIAIKYIAEPCMKAMESPYRAVYDARRTHTMALHPLPDIDFCETCQKAEAERKRKRQKVGNDCSHFGGPHWSKGHGHNDALRVTAKAITKDLWRVSRGMQPLFGVATVVSMTPNTSSKPTGQQTSNGRDHGRTDTHLRGEAAESPSGATTEDSTPASFTKPRTSTGGDRQSSDTHPALEAATGA